MNGDADFNTAAGGTTFDASFLEINFTPDPVVTQLNLEFRFYSEEYRQDVYSNFDNVTLVMVDGNSVPIPAGDGTISVNSINGAATYNHVGGSKSLDPNPGNGQFDSASPSLYIDNGDGSSDTNFDGFTVTLSLDINVTPGQSYDLKIGIADKGDSLWDSAFAVAANTGTVNEDPTALDDFVQVAQCRGLEGGRCSRNAQQWVANHLPGGRTRHHRGCDVCLKQQASAQSHPARRISRRPADAGSLCLSTSPHSCAWDHALADHGAFRGHLSGSRSDRRARHRPGHPRADAALHPPAF